MPELSIREHARPRLLRAMRDVADPGHRRDRRPPAPGLAGREAGAPGRCPRRLLYRARDVAAEAHRAVTGSIVEDSRIPLPEPGILSRLIVPGWAHLHSGLRIRGWIFLGAYLPLLVLGLARWGTPFGSILLGLAFSVHASSVMDILIRQGTVRFPKMMAMAVVVSLVLAVLIYGPAGWSLTRVAAPIEYPYDAPPFQRSDVVLINRWAYALTAPRRGDVVRFSSSNTHPVGGRGPVPEHAVRLRGERAHRPRPRPAGRPGRLGCGRAVDQRDAGLVEAPASRAVAQPPGDRLSPPITT